MIILNLLVLSHSFSQECVKASWVKSYGGNSLNNQIVDGSRAGNGTFILLGSYGNETLSLDSLVLPSADILNYYLARQDTSGTFIHAKSVMHGSGLMPVQMSIGPDGCLYVTGYWEGIAYIGDDTLPNATRKRVFVARFDSLFEKQWVIHTSWTSADCKPCDITTDLQNNAYITGNFEDNAFIIGGFTLMNHGGYNMWSDDGFVMKIDALGAVQWLKGIGSGSDESGRTITADSLGNLWITGTTQQSNSILFFSENFGIASGNGFTNMFLTQFRGSDGHCLWAKVVGGFNTWDKIYPWNAVLADHNSLVLCGEINGVVQVPPKSFYSSDNNGFVARFRIDGECEWLNIIGGSNSSETAFNVDYCNGIVAASGRLFSNQPYVGTFPLYSTQPGGSFDAFNAQFLADGTVLWARGNNSGSMSDYYNNCVLLDPEGKQYLWGMFRSTQTWYPHTLTNTYSNYQTFLVKFVPFDPAASFTVSAGPDKSGLCSANIQISGSTIPTNLPFGWYPDLGFSNNGLKTPNIQTSIPKDFILYATYQGCVLSDTVHVNLNNYNLLLQTLDGYSFCQGDSIQISASCNDTTAIFSWTPPKYISNASSPYPWVKPVISTNYIVTASAGGCSATDTVVVVNHPKPWLTLPKQDQYYSWWRFHLCQGYPVDFTMGGAENTYTILTPSLVTNVNNNQATLLADSTGSDILKVVASSPFGCINSDSVQVIVHGNQPAPAFLGTIADRSACEGDSLQLNIWITNSLLYDFQYGWYAGWEVDSLDGQGWKEINPQENYYEATNFSVGYPTSTYYSRLRIRTVNPDMNGYRYRAFVHDYCSPKAYSNYSTITVGPKITTQPGNKTLCAGLTDSIFVNSSFSNAQYYWEVKQSGSFVPLIDEPGVIIANGRFLRFISVQASIDSTIYRCRVEGCNAVSSSYSNPALVRVISPPVILWQSSDDTLCEGAIDSLMVVTSPGPYTYNWYENNSAINYNTGQMCCYNTNKLKFTPVYLYQNNFTYKLRIRNSQCAIDIYSLPIHLTVGPTSTVSWPGDTFTICQNPQPIFLTGGSPPGGTYSGPGVYGTIFNPMTACLGPNVITYTYTGQGNCGGSANRIFFVKEAPTATWDGGDTSVCKNEPPFILTGGVPAGGYYSGIGVVNDMFYASQVYTLSSYVTYHYFIANGCSDSKSRTFNIKFIPSVTYYGSDLLLCLDDNPVPLTGGYPAGGVYSGPGVVADTFYPTLAGIGIHDLAYTFTDPNGCHNSDHFLATVDGCVGSNAHPDPYFNISVIQNEIAILQAGYLTRPSYVEVYNLLGQKVHKSEITFDPERIGLDLHTEAHGLYFIRCYNDKEEVIRKIILE